MRHRPDTQQGGFSLLEILVAFAILGLSLGVLLNIFSSGLRAAIVAEDYQDALAIAEAQMAKVGLETDLAVGSTTGVVFNKFNWTVSVSPLQLVQKKAESNVLSQDPTLNMLPYDVQVSVTWSEGEDQRELLLNSVRIAKTKDADQATPNGFGPR